MAMSKRLSLATRWLVHQRYTASEHYHFINYGIGGQIEVHVDFWGVGQYDTHPGEIDHFLPKRFRLTLHLYRRR